MSLQKKYKLRVAICGAGIGGLTAAVALGHYPDIEIQIFEGALSLTEFGAGIGLFSRPWDIIQKLGLEADLLSRIGEVRIDGQVKTFRYRKSDSPVGIEFYTLVTQGSLTKFHRADFQRVLLEKLPPSCRVHCGKRLSSYTHQDSPNGPITMIFEDGTRELCDVLIGADGLKSAVRKSLVLEQTRYMDSESGVRTASPMASEPVWSGTNAYRALINASRLRARYPGHRVLLEPTQYLGAQGYIIAYPISRGEFVNFVAFRFKDDLEGSTYRAPWVANADVSEIRRLFKDWEPEVQALFDCVETTLRWAIHTVGPLTSYVSGGVALIGDAAHAMTPHQGSGAGQAIEDAYVLATLLGHPWSTRDTIARTLQVYDQIIRPLANEVQRKSYRNGQLFTFHKDGVDFSILRGQRLIDGLHSLGDVLRDNWEWCWSTTVDSAVEEAIRLMERR